MADSIKLANLIAIVAEEADSDRALNTLVQTVVSMTNSRNALLAVLNEELGALEVRHAVGRDVGEEAPVRTLAIAKEIGEGIVAYVAATGEPVLSGDVAKEPYYLRMFETTRSEMAVPIRTREGRISGVLNLESDKLHAFGEREDDLACAVAGLIAMVLEREDLQSREEALIEIGSALDNSPTEDALVERVVQVAGEVLRFQAASVFLFDPAQEAFVLRGSVGRLSDQIGQIAYRRGEGCTGWVCETGQPIRLDEPQSDERWRGRYLEFPSEQIASFLCVPIVSRRRSIGAIRVLRRKSDNRYLDNRFTETDQRLLEAIADQVASGLENVRNVEKIIRSERMIAWGELSAKSSHMIGNRVFALKGDINEMRHLLEENPLDRKALQELERSLATNVLRVEEILQDFRDFVSATQLHREPTDLNRLVKETVEEVFPRRSPIRLDLTLEDHLPAVEVDAKKLRRAVSELIENSMNWMEEGRLRVQTSVVEKSNYLSTRRSKAKRFARIEIEDSGPGVAEEKKEIIFQPFFSGRMKGMGLGLSIVKGIVDAHGGEVFEAGQPGEGANFVILLPIPDRP